MIDSSLRFYVRVAKSGVSCGRVPRGWPRIIVDHRSRSNFCRFHLRLLLLTRALGEKRKIMRQKFAPRALRPTSTSAALIFVFLCFQPEQELVLTNATAAEDDNT